MLCGRCFRRAHNTENCCRREMWNRIGAVKGWGWGKGAYMKGGRTKVIEVFRLQILAGGDEGFGHLYVDHAGAVRG